MKLYFMRSGLEGKMQIMEVNLEAVFDDSQSDKRRHNPSRGSYYSSGSATSRDP